MAASTRRTCYTSEQVAAFMNDDEGELDDCFYPGSDDELGFEEVEVGETEDENTRYGNQYWCLCNS